VAKKPGKQLPANGAGRLVVLRTLSGEIAVVAGAKAATLVKLAQKWMYILRNRSRWTSDEDAVAAVEEQALEDVGELGIDTALKEALPRSSHIEVEVVDAHDSGDKCTAGEHAAAVFPWEFVLSAATSTMGRSEPLLVTRLLRREALPALPPIRPSSFFFLQSDPGRLDGFYSFESERARLKAATGPVSWRLSDSDTLSRIQQRLSRQTPHAIHISGIDNHQAARIIDDFYNEDAVKKRVGPHGPEDGMLVRGVEIPEEPVPFYTLAAHVVSPAMRPWLVTCNLYYSSRIAEELVRHGAYGAMGFQDEINDELAELFFQEFYRCWLTEADAGDLPSAFGHAWRMLRERSDELFGTGVVLWLGRSAFERTRPAMRAVEDEDDAEPALPRLPTAAERTSTRLLPIDQVLQVEMKAPDAVNYSLLHNARPFLEKLTLSKLVEHSLDEVSVVVDLNVGDGSYPFRHTEALLTTSQRSLADLVQVPLTAPLLRSLRERVHSTLYACVKWDNRVAYEETRSVTLLPVDEWLDDTDQNPWLPSFILPRDPAVGRIISVARRHLVTLLDDSGAGFDGYQSIDNSLSDPAENVDLQVQAIWAALVHEFKIMYINPPPAYAKRTQRLRTPSEVVASNSGTCVDLALLLAGCLEYIDVYPVIVLLSGHAFVGYWRNSDHHDKFRRVNLVPASVGLEVGAFSSRSNVALVDPYGWRLGKQQYSEIRQYQRQDQLRFLEATGLCFDFSFAEAMEEGAANLRSPSDFDSLLDVRLARSATPAVTPLPILSMLSSHADEPRTR